MNQNAPNSNRLEALSAARLRIGVACCLSVLLCFAYALTRTKIGGSWYQANGGGVPYVVFWILLAGCLAPKRQHCITITLVAVVITCALEVLQLWNPEPLASFRRTKFGAALLGSSFSWSDIPPYFLGGAIGGYTLWLLGAVSPEESDLKTASDSQET